MQKMEFRGAEAPFRIALAGRKSFRIVNRAPTLIDLSTRPAPEAKNPNPELLFQISESVNRVSDLLHKNGQLPAFLPEIVLCELIFEDSDALRIKQANPGKDQPDKASARGAEATFRIGVWSSGSACRSPSGSRCFSIFARLASWGIRIVRDRQSSLSCAQNQHVSPLGPATNHRNRFEFDNENENQNVHKNRIDLVEALCAQLHGGVDFSPATVPRTKWYNECTKFVKGVDAFVNKECTERNKRNTM